MLKFGRPIGSIAQQSFIVPDIKSGIGNLQRYMKIGPFFVVEHFPLHDYHYRGNLDNLDVTAALAFSGGTYYELVQQNNDALSVYMETYHKRGWGFHHWAVASDDFDAHVKNYQGKGAPMALYGVTDFGTRVAYMDTTATLPGMLEVIELGPKVEEFFGLIQSASVEWDGRDPIRILG